MGTNNFHNVQARRIFAVDCQDEWAYDDAIDNIFYGLEEKFGKQNVIAEDKTPDDELRSFPAIVIATIEGEGRTYDGEDVYPVAEIIIRSGYYQGCNFDYNIKFNVWGEIYEDIDEINIEEIQYYSDKSEKQAERYTEWMRKHLEVATEKLRNQIEEVYAEYTIPLTVSAIFANGEATYARAN